MRNTVPDKPRYFVQSLAKGLSLIQIFAEAMRPLSLSEIGEAMGANNTTTTRLCYTLSHLGFIQRDYQKRYHLTPKILTLGCAAVGGIDWREIARYFMEQLFEEVQETVNLTVLEGSEILFVIRIRKIKYLPFDIRIGTKLPVHCTAMGKVLMALGPPQKTRPILETMALPPLTEFTITRFDDYLEELDQVRQKGYAVNDQELSELIRTVAVPILDIDGYAVAAIGISVPTTGYSLTEAEEKLSGPLIATSRQISKALIQAENDLVLGGGSQ